MTKNEKGFSALLLVMIIFLVFIIGGVGWYTYNQSKNNSSDKNSSSSVDVSALQKEIQDTKNELAKVQKQLAMATPDWSKVSPQCEGGNDKAVFGQINKEPVQGYLLFTVDCKTFLTSGKPQPRLVALKFNDDNSATFVYGASSVHPMCLDSSIVENSSEVSKSTGLPVCS